MADRDRRPCAGGGRDKGNGGAAAAETVAALIAAVSGERVAVEAGDPPVVESMTNLEAMARALWAKARGGDLTACRLVLEYTVGKPGTAPGSPEEGKAPEVVLTEAQLAKALAQLKEWSGGAADGG